MTTTVLKMKVNENYCHKIPIFHLKQLHINLKYTEMYVVIPRESTLKNAKRYSLKANRKLKLITKN